MKEVKYLAIVEPLVFFIYSSQKGRQNAIMMSYIVDNLTITTLKFVKVIAAIIKKSYIFTAVLLIKIITYIKFHEIVN